MSCSAACKNLRDTRDCARSYCAGGAINQSSFNTRNSFPNNNGIINNNMGMPGKDGSGSNKTDFVLGRKFYIQYRKPSNILELNELFKQKPEPGRQTSNTIVKTTRKEAGKPIPQNSNDLYIQRRRMLSIGKGSTKTKDESQEVQLKGGLDSNYRNKALTRLKASGSIVPPRIASGSVGPSQPSIFAKRVKG